MPWSTGASQNRQRGQNAEGSREQLDCTFILLALHVLQPIEGFPQYTISNIRRHLGCFWAESRRLFVLNGPMWTIWRWPSWRLRMKLNWLCYVVSGRQYMTIEYPGNALGYARENVGALVRRRLHDHGLQEE